MKKPELLAPAGDLEKLKIALLYGADAVYLGGVSFSLRARASNFTVEDIAEGVRFAHSHGKRVYVTTNIFPHPDDLEGFVPYVKKLEEIGVDALICASSGMIGLVRKHTNLNVHVSTQQSVLNHKAVNFWHERGASRTVLARELSLTALEKLARHSESELEVFIHGGMCVSYSGKCTLSNTMSNRDANRGGCAHSCRWNYDLFSGEDKLNRSMPFAMSSKDLQSVRHISKLIDLNIDSLKIEGRMKSVHYIATVVRTYRKLIDDLTEDIDVDIPKYLLEIKKAENRLTSEGFMNGMAGVDEQLYNLRSEQPTQAFVGMVLDYDDDSRTALIEQRNYFEAGDTLEIFTPRFEPVLFKVDSLRDEEGETIDVARHPKQRLIIDAPFEMKPFDILRKPK